MKTLEPKHLIPYLPYKLYLQQEHMEGPRAHLMTGISVKYNRMDIEDGNYGWSYILGIKPILHPLSDITKEIEHNGERFVPIEYFEIDEDRHTSYHIDFGFGNSRLIKDLQFCAERNDCHDIHFIPAIVRDKLIEWHFDVFGLIEKGLAIDINTLNQDQ